MAISAQIFAELAKPKSKSFLLNDCNAYRNQFWAQIIILKLLLCIWRDPEFHIWYTYQQWGQDLKGGRSNHCKQQKPVVIYPIVHIFPTEAAFVKTFMNGKSRYSINMKNLQWKSNKQHIQVRTFMSKQDSITFQFSNSFADTYVPSVEIPFQVSFAIIRCPQILQTTVVLWLSTLLLWCNTEAKTSYQLNKIYQGREYWSYWIVK